jgi:uncharacterized protein (UPF0335 family)
MVIANNQTLITAIDKKIQASEQRVEEKIAQNIQRLKQQLERKMKESHEDTRDVLSALMHTGYDMHEERIVRIENELDLPPIKEN